MASLPAGWVADYDGTRWFFRYAATDHIQYHFPKPGDEFPEFFSPFENSDDGLLLPEERLESERQVRKRAAVDGGGGGGHTRGARDERGQEDDDDDDDDDGEEGGGGMCFADFGYLGPGSYEDILGSPGLDNAAGAYELANNDRQPSVDAVSSVTSAGATTGPVSEPSNRWTLTMPTNEQHQEQEQQERQQQQQPRAAELPSSPPPPIPGQSPPPPHHGLDVNEVAMLNGRELGPSPVGHVAELVSEITARCEEEINPPPVELPDTNGASWLEPVPVPNLVNQYPVELPAVKHPDSLLETLGAKWDAAPARCEDQQRSTTHGNIKGSVGGEGSGSAWQTNWMSTSPSPVHAPPNVVSRSGLPSRQSRGSQDSQLSSHDEILHEEILNFFPAAARQPHGDLPVNTDPPRAASSPTRHIETRNANSSSVAPHLGQFPSVLRPGPRRSSRPLPNVQYSSSSPMGQTEAAASPPSARPAAQFKAYQPPRPRNPAVAGGRPHSQSVAEPTVLSVQPVHNDVVVMPNPADYFRAPRLPRSHTLQTTEPVPSWSPVLHSRTAESAPRREALHFVIPVRHFTAPAQGPAASPAHTRTPSAPDGVRLGSSSDAYVPQRPGGFTKTPSEPTRPVGMSSGASPPLPLGKESIGTLQAATPIEEGGEHSAASNDCSEEVDEDVSPRFLGVRASASLHETGPIVTTADPSEAMPRKTFREGVNTLGNNRLRHLIKRIGKLDKGGNGTSIESSNTEKGP